MNSHRVAAAAVSAIAAAFFAATFWFDKMPEGITRGFGAELFPRLVLGTIVALAIALAVVSRERDALPAIPGMVYITGAVLLAFMALVWAIGMLAAMFFFLLGLGYLWGERRYWLLGLNAVVMTAVIWAVFVRGFGVQLPSGFFA